MSAVENIADQPIVLSQMNSFSITGHNACGILAPMLNHSQGVIDRLIRVRVSDNADHSAHQLCLSERLNMADSLSTLSSPLPIDLRNQSQPPTLEATIDQTRRLILHTALSQLVDFVHQTEAIYR